MDEWSGQPLVLQFRFLDFSFDSHGKRPSLEPHSWNLYFTVGAIWFWISWWVIWPLYSGLVYVWYFRKTFIVLAKYNHEIYLRSNCLGWLHVTRLSSWWISSKIHFFCVCGTSAWTLNFADSSYYTSSTAQGGGGSFNHMKRWESGMAEWIILLEVSSLSLFFPTSLCGVLVFDSVSRAPSPPPPSPPPAASHTQKLHIQ